MSRKSFWAWTVVAPGALIAISWAGWSWREEPDAARTVQASPPSTPPVLPAAAPEPSWKGQGFDAVAAGSGKPIRVVNGLLSVSVNNQALGSVLEEIGRQSGIAFHVAGEMASRPLTVAVHETPIEQGLARILAEYDGLFYFGARNSSARGLRAVWIYPPGQGFAVAQDGARGQADRPGDAGAVHRSPLQEATDADPATRRQAISALAEGNEPGVDPAAARASLQTALSDPDPEVRAQALNGLVSRDPDSAYGYQVQGLRDADAAVRLMAVGTITAEGPGLALLQAALNDADEAVRVAARLQLEQRRPK